MARIVFCWELGQGLGHLVRYVALIRRLLERGDDVSFLAKDAARARSVFSSMQVNVEPVQPGSTPPAKALATLNSYPDILHNFGFCSADILARQLQPWLSRFAEPKPDILIIYHSPSALLANRLCRIPCVSSGNGFTVPPRTSPMRPLRYWAKQQDEQLLGNERRVLDVANLVLVDAGAVPMGQISDLLLTDAEWLLSFPELDHYGERDGTRYLGTLPADDFGIAPQWAVSSGPKIFAYLSQASVTSEFLDALHRLNVNLCLYAPNLAPGEIDKFNGERTCRSNSPVKLVDAAAQCDAAITNGSLNTMATLLSYGNPVLALPSSLQPLHGGAPPRTIGLWLDGTTCPRPEFNR